MKTKSRTRRTLPKKMKNSKPGKNVRAIFRTDSFTYVLRGARGKKSRAE